MKENLNEKAMRSWEEKAFKDMSSDFKVNDLLENIAKEAKSAYHADDIWITICNLPNSAKRKFIRLAAEI